MGDSWPFKLESEVAWWIMSFLKSLAANKPVFTLMLWSNLPPGKKKWKKTCCIPSFVIFLFIVTCLIMGMGLLAVFKVDGQNQTVNAVLISMASVIGLALLLNCRTWWQVTDSVLNSQRKRLHSAANKMNKLKSEGFMKVSFTLLFVLLASLVDSKNLD